MDELAIMRRRVAGLEKTEAECKKMEEALQKSEATLQGIMRAVPIGIGIVSNRILRWANEQISNMTGYSSDELFGRSVRMLYESDEEFEQVGKIKHAEIRKKGTGAIETRWRRKDGSVINIFLSSSQIDPNDFSAGLVFTAMDVTDRRLSEEALRDSEERYRYIVQHAPAVIYEVDLMSGKFDELVISQNPCHSRGGGST